MADRGHTVDRRTTLKWFAGAFAASGGAGIDGLAQALAQPVAPEAPLGTAKPIFGIPYGGDPSVMTPKPTWDLTMTEAQRAVTSVLAEAIVPAEGDRPSAAAIGAQDFVDEWISAPYPRQQEDRASILAFLDWCETEARASDGEGFAACSQATQRGILDRVAWQDRIAEGLATQASQFRQLRVLVVSAYFATDAGRADIGYLGGTPMGGDYPGPTPEAIAHLEGALSDLGLAMPEDT